jgi:hypothetical protein
MNERRRERYEKSKVMNCSFFRMSQSERRKED